MNINVNLIRPGEQRSASLVSLKSLGLMVAILFPLILVLFLGWTYMGYLEVRSALKPLEQEQQKSERQKNEALALIKLLRTQKALNDEVQGFHDSRVPWHEVLDNMIPLVPDTMQWVDLKMRMEMQVVKDGQILRDHVLMLNGRCKGPNADEQVETFRREWLSGSIMTQWVEKAEVVAFREDDAPDAGKEDRKFQIDVKFHPGRFHAPTGK